MASKERKINSVGALCLAGAAIALVVEVDGNRLGVVCIEVTALFLSKSVASDHWEMLASIGQRDGLEYGHLQMPVRR